jgi:hypothetical protein
MPSSIVPYLPLEFDAWWERASSRDIEARFQSAKELSDSLAVALGLTAASTVAAAPPGFREAAMSDYSLSVSANESAQDQHMHGGGLWPATRMGKLLATGVVGVAPIAGTMSYQKSQEAAKEAQGLVTPAAPVTAPAAESPSMPATPQTPTLVPFDTSPGPPLKAGTRDAAPKVERKESRRGMSPKDLPKEVPPAPPPPRVVVDPQSTKAAPAVTTTTPTKPKDVDFGI